MPADMPTRIERVGASGCACPGGEQTQLWTRTFVRCCARELPVCEEIDTQSPSCSDEAYQPVRSFTTNPFGHHGASQANPQCRATGRLWSHDRQYRSRDQL